MANVLPAGFEDEFSDDSDDYNSSFYKNTDYYTGIQSGGGNSGIGSNDAENGVTWETEENWADTPQNEPLPPEILSRKLNTSVEFPIDDLRVAILNGDLRAVQYFIENGTEIDILLKGDWTPLLYASNAGHPEIMHYLLEQHASPNYHNMTERFFPLMAVCTSDKNDENCILKCVALLVDHGAKVDCMDRYHMTPLMYAAKRGHLTIVQKLLEFNADPNVTDNQRWSALFHAANNGFMAVVMELMKNGAHTGLKDHRRHTAADIAYLRSFEEVAAYIDDSYKHIDEKPVPVHRTGDNVITGIANRCGAYGQLELFLCGLNLQSSIPKFKEHNITFSQLLTLSEHDLEKIGVEQIGSRKMLVEAIRAVHQMEWQTSSLMKIHYDQSITCADTAAMLANLSQHALYMTSTIVYMCKQIELHPAIIDDTFDARLLQKLMHHSMQSLKNADILNTQLHKFNGTIQTLLEHKNLEPVEAIPENDKNLPKRKSFHSLILPYGIRWRSVCVGSVTFLAVASFWRKEISRSLIPLRIPVISRFMNRLL
ncbi:ankyrin repeat, SAM and basic leucine zipper domain-containing protein 1-like [Argonauta hians]